MKTLVSLAATLTVSVFFAVPSRLHAQEPLCGAPPSLSTSAQTEESIKGQLKGQADILSKLVGKAELEGQVDAARKQIYQSSDRFLAAQKDAYLSYMFCVIIIQDKSLSTTQKLDAINTFKKSPTSSNNTVQAHVLFAAIGFPDILIKAGTIKIFVDLKNSGPSFATIVDANVTTF